MELEEVKEHFKNAKEVRCLVDGKAYSLDDMTTRGIYSYHNGSYWFDRTYDKGGNGCQLWSSHDGFAEIISYKKDAQRIKEDCELLDKFVKDYLNSGLYLTEGTFQEKFKKDNGLIIEPEKPKYSESVQQAIDALTNEGYLVTIDRSDANKNSVKIDSGTGKKAELFSMISKYGILNHQLGNGVTRECDANINHKEDLIRKFIDDNFKTK
jgi:hypothetical protein